MPSHQEQWFLDRYNKEIKPAYIQAGVNPDEIKNFYDFIGEKGWVYKSFIPKYDKNLFNETTVSVSDRVKIRPKSLSGKTWDADFGDYIKPNI